MRNFFKFLGIIAMVAVIGFSMIGCDLNEADYEMLNGDWELTGYFVVSFTNDVGVFKEITGGNFKIALDKGNVRIGSQKFRNIKKAGDLKWSAQERLVLTDGSGVLSDWADCTITMDSSGQTLYSSVASSSITLTRK